MKKYKNVSGLKYKTGLFIVSFLLFIPDSVFCQNVGIGTATPVEKLHVIGNIRSSTLAGVGNRLVIADLNGTLLTATGATSPAWMTTGNSGTIPIINFLGTTDNADLRIRTNNVERVTIKNTGSIGLFTNTPVTSWLHSVPTTLVNDWQFKWDNTLNGDAPARFQNTPASNGNRVFLGVTNYNGTGFAASAAMGLALNNTNTTPVLAGGEGVRGFSNSVSGIGVYAGFVGGSTGVIGWALYAGGWAGGITPWLIASDEKLKKDVSQITGALAKIKQIRGVEYNFNTAEYSRLNLSQKKQTGFIAQEVEKVFPSMVHDKAITGDSEPMRPDFSSERISYNVKTIAYTDMIPVLVEAIKEQQTIIEELKSRIEILENEK